MPTTPADPASMIIGPLPWGDADEFWAGTRAGELRVPRCPDTGRCFFPPAPTSPFGSHREPEWVTVGGHGTIWSFIVAHPPLVGQFAAAAPYVTAVVELGDVSDLRLVGAVVAHLGAPLGSVAAADVRVGAPVTVDLTNPEGLEYVVPRWVLDLSDAH
jgi:uncharacterized OB-fold protein